MSFEYRELTTQVFLNAGQGDKSPCKQATCHGVTREDCEPCNTCGTTTIEQPTNECDDEDCNPCNTCGTTTLDQPSDGCDDDDDQGKDRRRQALGLLRQQLRDTLAAG